MSSKSATGFLLLIGIVGVLTSAYLGFDLWQTQQRLEQDAQLSAREEVSRAAGEINAELRRLSQVGQSLADDAGSGRLKGEGLASRLHQVLSANTAVHSVGLAYAPFAFSRDRRLHAPSLARAGELFRRVQLEASVDYTKPEVEWYSKAIQKGSGWSDPVWVDELRGTTATYAAPFSASADAGANPPSGVVFLRVFVARVTEATRTPAVGSTGWTFLISRGGYAISHPLEQVVRNRVTISQIAEEDSDPSVLEAYEKALQGEGGLVERETRATGQGSWIAYEPISETGWTIVIVRIKDEVTIDDQFFRRRVIWVSVTAILGLISLASWFSLGLWAWQESHVALWWLVAFCSALLLCGMGVIRHVTYNQLSEREQKSVRILDHSGLQSFLRSEAGKAHSQTADDTVYVPTGVFIQSMEISGPNEVFAKGYVWQKLAKDLPAETSTGLILPDAVQVNLSEAYRRDHDGVETVGWYFEARVRQRFNLSRYPFDHEAVSLRLRTKNFDTGVVLVPDLDSYTLINPTSKPGLSEDLAMPGWHISGSFFDYKFSDYRSNFGMAGPWGREPVPDLSFNVSVKRNLLDPAIGNGIPLFVVVLMLFAMVASATTDQQGPGIAGFPPSAMMLVTPALFFAVLLAHIHLRETIQVYRVVFMEYI